MKCHIRILSNKRNTSGNTTSSVIGLILSIGLVFAPITAAGIASIENGRSSVPSTISPLTETRNVSMMRAGANDIPFGSSPVLTALQRENTWLFGKGRAESALFAVGEKAYAPAAVNDCAWLWTTTTKRERSEDCFVTAAISLSESFPLSACFDGRLSTLSETGVDRAYLCRLGELMNVPTEVVLAVAWAETRRNLNPSVRGRYGEIGRFQIGAALWRCRDLIIRRYADNVLCGIRILRQLRDQHGTWAKAMERYNGGGRMARIYRQRAEEHVGRVRLLLLERP